MMGDTAAGPAQKILITGVTGQDGYYLARLMLGRGAKVCAGVRDPGGEKAEQLTEDLRGIELVRFDLADRASIATAVAQAAPDLVFHLAGMSGVKACRLNPLLALELNTAGTLVLLESLRLGGTGARLVFAGTVDCFDHAAAPASGVTPTTPIQCSNPYAISKLAAIQFVQRYREEHGLWAAVAFMFNHTSPRRPAAFIERLIVHQAVEVSRGKRDQVVLGSMDSLRDWSWAEDIVEGLAAMARADAAEDFVLASGRVHTTGDWVRMAFDRLGLDLDAQLKIESGQVHRGDNPHTFGDITEAAEKLGWRPKTSFDQIVDRLIDAEQSLQDEPEVTSR